MTSTAIYTCYRQLHPPTGVDHAIFGSVTACGSRDLVVAKACILELYRVHREDEDPTAVAKTAGSSRDLNTRGGDGGIGDSDDASSFYLELAGTFPLAGNITSLAVIPVAATTTTATTTTARHEQQDILAVSFGAAKVALVAYDPLLGRLETLSIHNFDAGAIGPGAAGVESGYGLASALKDRPKTISASEPSGRCMAAVVAGCQLVVLPVRRYVPRSVFMSKEASRRRRLLRNRRRAAAAAKVAATAAAAARSSSGGTAEEAESVSAGGAEGDEANAARGNGSSGFMSSGAAGGDFVSDDEDDFSVGARESESEEERGTGDASSSSGGHAAVSKSFTIDLEEAGITGFIKASAFLEGFHEPALALLYEPMQTCAGRLASKRSTCRLVLLSINLAQGRAPVFWQVDGLPHDSWDLLAVPSPVGGVQVISTNAVIHVNQSEVRSVLAVNGYAKATVDPDELDCPLRVGSSDWGWASFRRSHSEREVVDLSTYDVCVELDVVKCAFLTPTSMLISLRTGEVYALRLHLAAAAAAAFGAPNRVVGQSMRPVGRASPCSVLAVSTGVTDASAGLVFMGSRVGDSLLVKYAVSSAGTRPGKQGKTGTGTGVAAKPEPKPKEQEEVMAERDEREEKKEERWGTGRLASSRAPSTGREASGEPAGLSGRGRSGADSTLSAGVGGAIVKEEIEEKDGAGVTGMGVGSASDAGGGEVKGAVDDDIKASFDHREGGLRTSDAGGGVGSSPKAAKAAAEQADELAAETGDSNLAGVIRLTGRDGERRGDPPPAATPNKRPSGTRSSQEREEKLKGEGGLGAESGGSAKRGRAEGSSSYADVPGDGGVVSAAAARGAEEEDQPGRKRSRVVAPATSAGENSVVSSSEAGAGAGAGAGSATGVVEPAPGGSSSRAAGEKGKKGQVGSLARGAAANSLKATPAVAMTSSATTATATTTGLSREELDMIEEEEALYGARLGSSPASTSDGAHGGVGRDALQLLGSTKGSERVIEAVGFRLKVVDSICSLGPIVDAALVPSAYHIPKRAALGGAGGRGGRGNGGRSRGQRGGRGPGSKVAPGGGSETSGGSTSGGGIRTSLVCASGYGGQGSLSVFSAGLRTEVVVELSVPGAIGVYTAPEGSSGSDGGSSESRDTLVLVSCSSPQQEDRSGHTRVLAFQEDSRVVELPEGDDDNPFVCDAATTDVCVMAEGTVVQAHEQGLRVTRDRCPVQDVLASEDPELGGLGAETGVTVVRTAAAGSYACCLLSNRRLHLMALDDGDLMPVLDATVSAKAGERDGGDGEGMRTGKEEEEAVGGALGEAEAMFMFGVKERRVLGPTASGAVTSASSAGRDVSMDGSIRSGVGSGGGLFLEGTSGGSRSREERDLQGGVFDDTDEEDDDTDEEDEEDDDGVDGGGVGVGVGVGGDGEDGDGFNLYGGYRSEEEEWATLYGAFPGRGVLNPCSSGQPADGTAAAGSAAAAIVAPGHDRQQLGGGGAAGLGSASFPEQSAEGESLPHLQHHLQPQPQPHQSKGWWGGSAWGGMDCRPGSGAGGEADVEAATASNGDGDGDGACDATRVYLVVCRRGGVLEVFSCEGQGAEETKARPVFRTSGAALAPATLWNELLVPPVVTMPPQADGLDEEEGGRASSLVNGGGESGRGGGSPMDDGDDEREGGDGGEGGLEVATGVIVANGSHRKVGRGGGGGANASAGAVAGTAETGSKAATSLASDPMEDDAALRDTSAARDASVGGSKTAAENGGAAGVGGSTGAVASPAAAAVEEDEDGVVCPEVTDVIVHPVGAVDGPPELRRLVLAMHLDNGNLLVYEAKMTIPWRSPPSSSSMPGDREQVVCFSKLCHDLITRPVKGVPPEAAVSDPGRGRALRGIRSAAGQEGVCFARPGCRSALILAERGAVCVTAIAQDDLGDGSGNPPLPPGAPPSWAGIGLGSLAPLCNSDAFPGGGGGFAGITAGGGRLRFISAAPAASQLVTPGTSGGGGLGGGGQGHFVAEKVRLGATVHSLVHLPHQLAHAGKTGDILKQLLRERGHYVALVSTMEDAMVEQPKAVLPKGDGEQGDGDDDEEEEAAGLLDRHVIKHKNWTVADPNLGGAPPLLVPRFELRVLALKPAAASPSSPTTAVTSSAPGRGAGDDKGANGASDATSGKEAGGDGEDGQGHTHGGASPGLDAFLSLSATVVESHPMDSDENCICMTLVRLEQGGSLRMYLAVGTGMNESKGEDKAARGRLLLFEVDYAYLTRENGKHEYAVKLKQVFAEEQLGPVSGESGPVSAVAQLGRHLVLSVGKKVIVNRWDPKSCTLELIGFHDPRVYVTSLSVIKNRFILVGDAYGSVQLVVWREEDHSLTPLSKDHEDCEVFSTEYLIDEPGMAIVVADGRRNIKVLQYAPNATNSRGGTKLLCQSDFYLGSRVAKLTRRRTRGNLRDGARYCLLAGTLDGGLGAILPVDERVFRRLYALQGIMNNALGHNGAANPRAYRLFDHGPTFRCETKQNMLDGSLLWRFVGLDARTQHDLTRAIGTTVDRVMANLLDIDLASLF